MAESSSTLTGLWPHVAPNVALCRLGACDKLHGTPGAHKDLQPPRTRALGHKQRLPRRPSEVREQKRDEAHGERRGVELPLARFVGLRVDAVDSVPAELGMVAEKVEPGTKRRVRDSVGCEAAAGVVNFKFVRLRRGRWEMVKEGRLLLDHDGLFLGPSQ